jgi:hypothetical protein
MRSPWSRDNFPIWVERLFQRPDRDPQASVRSSFRALSRPAVGYRPYRDCRKQAAAVTDLISGSFVGIIKMLNESSQKTLHTPCIASFEVGQRPTAARASEGAVFLVWDLF